METTQIVEIWRGIKGYEDYLVSTEGRIWSKKNNIFLKQSDSHGYLLVGLYNKEGMKMHRVHRLVAKAFIQNPENKEEVNHKDGDKTNNSLINLEWVTPKENSQHAWKTGLASKDKGITKKNHWILDHLEEIKKYLEEGYAFTRVGELLECDYRLVMRVSEQFGFTRQELKSRPHYSRMKLDEEEIKLAYKLLIKGKRFTEINKELDIDSKEAVARTLRRVYGKEHIDKILKKNKKK